MKVRITEHSWGEFKTMLSRYSKLDFDRKRQIVFRGQRDSAWQLETTLDRAREFSSQQDRMKWIGRLMKEFRRESIHADSTLTTDAVKELKGELLARHHGLPTPYLDWTDSPYIAAYFAYADVPLDQESTVSVWMLDRDKLEDYPQIRILDDEQLIRLNPRALRQRSLFLRVNDSTIPMEDLMVRALHRIDLPPSDRREAMSDLDEMQINASTLFRNLDGVARSVAQRLLEQEGS